VGLDYLEASAEMRFLIAERNASQLEGAAESQSSELRPRTTGQVVGNKQFAGPKSAFRRFDSELEPLCGRPSPQAKS
jgi:hypothetical protein